MKNFPLIIALLMWILSANAQDFKRKYTASLSQNMTSIQANWVSMNADSLLDLVITGVTPDGQFKIVPFQNIDTVSIFNAETTILTGMKSGYVQVADWDRDNKMDLVIAGKTLINTDAIFVFTGNGDFTFTKQSQKILDYSGQFRVADMNSDAAPDIITFGASFIRIYSNSGTALTKEFELTDFTPTDISTFDINKDGMIDFVVTGKDLQNKVVTTAFINHPKFKFTKTNAPTPVNGQLSLADLNSDGYFDVIVADEDRSTTWKNNGDTLIVDNVFNHGTKSSLFTGDINSDGKSDIATDSIGLLTQIFGDQDRDGDLDVVHINDSIGSQWIKFYRNITPATNARPQQPAIGFAISTFDRTFIFWDPANDDHTATFSITYDVWLGKTDSNIIAPAFDLSNARRTIVAHGNAGTNTSMIIKGLADDRYFYAIKSVDNAYNGSYGQCGGGVLPCFDLVHNDVQACKGAEVKLNAGQNATWFSLSKGFLEETDILTFIATASDTLFAFVPQNLDCSKNKVYVVHVNDAPPSEKETIYACKGKTIKLSIDDGWDNITWDTNPPTNNVTSIQFTVTRADTVHVTADGSGCQLKKEFFIKISEPVVAITGDGFQLMKGNSAQLEATGTAAQWQWDPPQGLSNSTVPNPLATPATTTEYVVTGTDSVGCTATARIQVVVQETAFVPNLFTPNGDGKNDNLVIYGLTTTSTFKFRIFNREGSTVYETKELSHATSVGWNGLAQGIRQPSGIYYWKIDGEMPDGSKLLLNGKTTGSILLVH